MSNLYMWDKFSIGGNPTSVLPKPLGEAPPFVSVSLFGDNGTFDTDISGWTATRGATVSHTEQDTMFVQTNATPFGSAARGFDTETGVLYRIRAEIKTIVANTALVTIATSATDFGEGEVDRTASTGPINALYYLFGDGVTYYVHCTAPANNGNWAVFDNVFVDTHKNLVLNGAFNASISGWTTLNGTAVFDAGRISITTPATDFGTAFASFPTTIGNTYQYGGRLISSTGGGSFIVAGQANTGIVPEYNKALNNSIVLDQHVNQFVATQDRAYLYLLSPNTNGANAKFDNVFAVDLGVI